MTPKQRHHLLTILEDFRTMTTMKYMKGQAEHGGNLWEQTPVELITNAMDETIDQYVYLHTLREKLLKRGRKRNAATP